MARSNESFGEAFARNHSALGAGQRFQWRGNSYTTDRADGRDLKKEREGRALFFGTASSLESSSQLASAVAMPSLAPSLAMPSTAMPSASSESAFAISPELVSTIVTTFDSIFGKKKDDSSRYREELARVNREHSTRMSNLQKQLDTMTRERETLKTKMESDRRERAKQDARFAQEMKTMEERARQDREKHAKELSKMSIDSVQEQLAQTESHLRDLMRQLQDTEEVFQLQKEDQDKLVVQIHDEKRKVQLFEEERNDPSIKNIVLIGMTGDGKSTFGNRLLGDTSLEGNVGPFQTSDSIHSETQMVLKSMRTIRGTKVSIADTPGIADSQGHDRNHINNVVSFLRGCGGVNQFVLVKTNSNSRWSEHYQDMLRNFEHIFGEGLWEYVTIVLSHVEGRAGLMKFEKNRPEVDRYIRSTFRAASNVRLPIIASGLDDYPEAVENLVFQITPDTRYSCDRLTSPLDDLEAQLRVKQQELTEAEKDVKRMRKRVEDVGTKKESLARRLQQLRGRS